MICARCHQAIRRGQDYERRGKFSVSGAGISIVIHKGDCPPKPH